MSEEISQLLYYLKLLVDRLRKEFIQTISHHIMSVFDDKIKGTYLQILHMKAFIPIHLAFI